MIVIPQQFRAPSFRLFLAKGWEATALERFHNLRALSGIVKGGYFLRKKPLYGSGSRVQQLWNSPKPAPFLGSEVKRRRPTNIFELLRTV
jgi:hypothetical protein